MAKTLIKKWFSNKIKYIFKTAKFTNQLYQLSLIIIIFK